MAVVPEIRSRLGHGSELAAEDSPDGGAGGERTARLDPDVWEELFEPNPAPMAVYERSDLVIVAVNEAARMLYGYDRATCLGMTAEDLFPSGEVEERRRELVSGSEDLLGTPRIVRHRLADGRLAEMQVTSRPVAWCGRAARVVTMADVTHLRQVEAELGAEAGILRRVVALQAEIADTGPDVDRALRLVASGVAQLVEAANCSVWWADGDRLVVRATAGSPQTYSLGDSVPVSGSLAGSCYSSGQLVHVEDTATHSDYARGLGERTGIGSLALIPIVHAGATLGALGVSARAPHAFRPAALEALRLVAGLVGGAVQRAEATDRLAYAASHDALTGLSNRSQFTERLEHAITASRRHGSNVGVLYIDVDRFKAINDSLGHPVGDEVLVEVSERLRTAVREIDTVARLGGDEFAVVLSEVRSATDVSAVAERILAALKAPVVTSGTETYVTASIGAATSQADDLSATELLRRADEAMYEAKAGRGCAAPAGWWAAALSLGSAP
jgi:diguanylate cyclase (GGDEF)-like protein/PAS domain S-box-containing protein